MEIIDDLGRKIILHKPPERIVSLVPSVTETLCDLGLANCLAGVTDYCIHPGKLVKGIQKVGGTKTVDLNKIRVLDPDIIIAVKEENKKETIEYLAKSYPVVVLDVNSFDKALEMIHLLGRLFGKVNKATEMTTSIRQAFKDIRSLKLKKSYLYLIWKDPYLAAGSNSYIHSLLSLFSLSNCVAESEENYPRVNISDHCNCDLIFLPSEPYPFRISDKLEIRRICKNSMVFSVDGEMFSWYGSRMILSAKYIKSLIPVIKQKASR